MRRTVPGEQRRVFFHVFEKYLRKFTIPKKIIFRNFYNHRRERPWAGKLLRMQYTGVWSLDTSKNQRFSMPNQRFALPKPGFRCQNLRWGADILTARRLLGRVARCLAPEVWWRLQPDRLRLSQA